MRLPALVTALMLSCATFVVAPAAMAGARTGAQAVDPTTTTTTTSTPPAPTTGTGTPPGSTTPTTTTTPRSPDPAPTADSAAALTAAESAALHASFHVLTDAQRALLSRLQQTRDDLAKQRFAVLALANQVAESDARLAKAEAAEQTADAAAAIASRTLARLRGEVEELAGAMYRHLDHTAPLAALDTTDAVALSRARTYAEAPGTVLDARVRETNDTRRQLARARQRAAQARAGAVEQETRIETALVQQRRALVAAEAANANALTLVTEALGSGAALLSQVADPHFGADAITAALAVAQAGDDDPVTVFGAFHLPIPGAPLGSPYGMRVDPITGAAGYHPGIDLEADAGTPIRAAAAGTVVMAGDCGGYGNCVVLAHGHSLATLYAHQSAVLVTAGQQVGDGQVVGLVGSTGKSTGPHLHFEVRLHGAPIDPMATLVG